MKNSAFILVLFMLILNSSCGTKKQLMTLKPEPSEASPLVYEHSPSFINIPISVKLKDIENQTNALLKGLIYEDNTIEDDDIEIKIWKLAPITIKNDENSKGNKIKITLPLKAKIKYRVGTSTLGMNLYKTNEFNLNGVVTLTSDLGLTNWQLKSKTDLKSLEWVESPSMVVFGKNVPVTAPRPPPPPPRPKLISIPAKTSMNENYKKNIRKI